MSRIIPNKFQASLVFEIEDQANNEAQLLHYAGIRIASFARDPLSNAFFSFELAEPVPMDEEIIAVHGYEMTGGGDPLPLNASVVWVSPTLRQVTVLDGSGGGGGVDSFHLDITFYRRNRTNDATPTP